MRRLRHPLAAIETAHANVKTGLIDYAADLPLEGYLAYDESIQGKRPGVLVAHTQRGIQEFVREQTRELGKLGYVALAADFYGKGIRPLEDEPAGVQSRKIKGDRALTRRRIPGRVRRAARTSAGGGRPDRHYRILRRRAGGARTRALRHAGAGDRRIPRHADDANAGRRQEIKGRVLVLHGADDQTAPMAEVEALIKEMRAGAVDFQLELYGGVKHGFTEPLNNKPNRNTLYNERAAKQSWASMQTMFKEVFHT